MNKFDFIIRKETEKDYREVENLAREAFWNLSVPGCFEHYFIHIMRDHSDFVRELDYVAETDGRIVGSVMYCKAKLRDEQGNEKDILTMRIGTLRNIFDTASSGQDRYSRSEIKMVTVVDVKQLSKQIDTYSAQLRQLDIKIQSLNFQTDLI